MTIICEILAPFHHSPVLSFDGRSPVDIQDITVSFVYSTKSFLLSLLIKLIVFSYSVVFIQGTDVTGPEEVAIKLECIKTKHPQLHIESKIYKIMQGGSK